MNNIKFKEGEMYTEREFLDEAWCRLANKKYMPLRGFSPDLLSLRKSEWYEPFELMMLNNIKNLLGMFMFKIFRKIIIKFIQYMKNRLIMGALRYGPLKTKTFHNLINRMKEKIKIYEDTQNTEVLVDIANYALLEFLRVIGIYKFKSLDGNHKRLDRR